MKAATSRFESKSSTATVAISETRWISTSRAESALNGSFEKKIIALAALTGLRQGELLSLEPTNVHGGRILLRPGQTKSGKARVVPVPKDARPWLEELPFDTTYAKLRRTWENARHDIGRPDLRFHDLRHSYASLLA